MGVAVGVVGDGEAVAAVEADGILPGGCGFEDDLLVLFFLGNVGEMVEYGGGDSLPPFFLGNGHAQDTAVAIFRNYRAGTNQFAVQ